MSVPELLRVVSKYLALFTGHSSPQSFAYCNWVTKNWRCMRTVWERGLQNIQKRDVQKPCWVPWSHGKAPLQKLHNIVPVIMRWSPSQNNDISKAPLQKLHNIVPVITWWSPSHHNDIIMTSLPVIKLLVLVYIASNNGVGPLKTVADPVPSTMTLRMWYRI